MVIDALREQYRLKELLITVYKLFVFDCVTGWLQKTRQAHIPTQQDSFCAEKMTPILHLMNVRFYNNQRRYSASTVQEVG